MEYKRNLYGLSIGTKIGDLERRNGSYFTLFYRIRQLWGPITSKWLKIDRSDKSGKQYDASIM